MLYCTVKLMSQYGHIHTYYMLCALNNEPLLYKFHIIQIFFQTEGVMINIILFVLILLDKTRLTDSIDLCYALSIKLEKSLWVNEVAKWEKSGSDRG